MQPQDFLLCQHLFTRMCHDLAGLSGNTALGLEMAAEAASSGADPAAPLALAATSAKQTVARVKFFRAAMGREGPITGASSASACVRDYLATLDNGDALRFGLDWRYEETAYDRLRLGLVGVLALTGALPRGGHIEVDGDADSLRLTARGAAARFAPPPADMAEADPKTAVGALLRELAAMLGGKVEAKTSADSCSLFIHF
ncbi:hypothetical protein FACS1894186_7680 [Alphaproteobacteria bacterium]|nr:hypothetical protein FACS1894186_7680 [Alphaproteobacteria bacterium]